MKAHITVPSIPYLKKLKRCISASYRRVLFTDVKSLIDLGRTKPLEASDLPDIPCTHNPRHAFQLFAGLRPLVVKADGKVSERDVIRFLWDIALRVKRPVIQMVMLSFAMIACELAGPMIIHRLLTLVSHPENTWNFYVQGTLAATALGLAGACTGIVGQHYIYKLLNVGILINSGLNHRIFDTSLRLTRLARQKNPTGDVVNLMGSDADAVQDLPFAVNEVIAVILTITGAATLMVHYLGHAGYAAVAILLLLVPPTKWVAKKFCLHSDAVSAQRDLRAAYMTQVLTGIRIVKSFSWERLVEKRVAAIRKKEMEHRLEFINAAGISVVLYRSIGTIAGAAIFGAMILLGEELSAAKLFTAMALIGVMEGPFGQLTDLLSMVASGRVSAERIGKFLAAAQVSDAGRDLSIVRSPVGLEFKDASFQFDDAEGPVLSRVTLQVRAGQSVAIVGPVGAGKSSLIAAVLGEISCTSGHFGFTCSDHSLVHARPAIAYVPQEAYVLNATLRDNILFGCESMADEREPLIHSALRACSLDADVARFTGGLDTEIGEHGVNLSGGQKQRVALARAVMQNPSLVLLDDPLSALDHKTEDLIVERLLFGDWDQLTRVVVTHRLKHLYRFDHVVFVEAGVVVAQGSFQELLRSNERFAEFYGDQASKDDSESLEFASLEKPSDLAKAMSPEKFAQADAALLRITENEDRQYGAVHRPHYGRYLKSMGSGHSSTWQLVCLFACAMIATTAMPIVLNSWIGSWGDALVRGGNPVSRWVSASSATNIWIYAALASLSGFVAWAQYVLYGRGGVRAGQNLHDAMLKSVLGARVRFFDATPVGRILNRFARDLDTIERNLPWSFEQTIRCGFHVIGSLILITVVLPWTLVITVPVMGVYYLLQLNYRTSSREAQRLYSVTRSPRFSHFKETLTGLSVLRAFDREDFFRDQFLKNLLLNVRMFHGLILLNRWFSVRVSLTAGFISIAVGVASVWSVGHGVILAGTAGLVITYGMKFWDTLNWAVRSFSQLEAQMTSVERVTRFAEIPQEESEISNHTGGDLFVSKRGLDIEFANVHMRYADHLPVILKGLSFRISAGQRVGLMGKTGAGKSSVFHTLFRFSEVLSGDVLIGGVSTRDMSLQNLRSLISVVPQDPTLFLGTFRSNCDPFDQFSDDEIWDALARVEIAGRVRAMPEGLDSQVAENGLNLSQGERQLVCLARALLSRAPIILMDEATSGIDVETDALIQATIRREFVGRTILVIAHRLATIADCDQIIEIKDGVAVGRKQVKVEAERIRPSSSPAPYAARFVGDLF